MLQVHEMTAPMSELNGTSFTIGIVVARYNWSVTGQLLHLALERLRQRGVAEDAIQITYAPGSFELSLVAQKMLEVVPCDALICFGCVMKGETRHDVVVSDAAAQGIQRVALEAKTPIIFGVICAENMQQAEARVTRGAECADAALEMVQTLRGLKQINRKRSRLCLPELLKRSEQYSDSTRQGWLSRHRKRYKG